MSFLLCIRESRVHILVRRPGVLTQGFRGFPQSLLAQAVTMSYSLSFCLQTLYDLRI